MRAQFARRFLTAFIPALLAAGLAVSAPAQAAPPDFVPPFPGAASAQPGQLGCFPLPGLQLSPNPQVEIELTQMYTLVAPNIWADAGSVAGYTPMYVAPTFTGSPDAQLCLGIQEASFVGRARFHVEFTTDNGTPWSGYYQLFIGTPVVANYFPPNPAPVAVPAAVEGEDENMGCFAVPGLLMTDSELEIMVDHEFQGEGADTAQPVAEPPHVTGTAESTLCVGVKGDFTGVATFLVTLKSGSSGVSHTWTLQLYVGVPLPQVGSSPAGPAALGGALLLAGLALVTVARRRSLA